MVDRIVLVHRSRGRQVDGIRDHGERLAEELSRQAMEIEYEPDLGEGRRGELKGWLRAWRRLRKADQRSAVVVQYNPFSYARWGFAPWLPALCLALRLSRPRPVIAVMVHEPYVAMVSWRWTLMGAWQRLQLTGLRISADVVFTSIDSWIDKFRRWPPRRPVHHLPVGSNLPDRRAARLAERRRAGFDDETVVIAAFGRNDHTWLADYATKAVNAIVEGGTRVALLNLGADAPPLPKIDSRVVIDAPGYLDHGQLAERLAAADLFLAPLNRGISTRRGTVMAALQHGVPVVATVGPVTDSILRRSGSAISLTPVGDPIQFANAAVRAVEDEPRRAAQAAAARQLYERNFDWPVVTERLLAAL